MDIVLILLSIFAYSASKSGRVTKEINTTIMIGGVLLAIISVFDDINKHKSDIHIFIGMLVSIALAIFFIMMFNKTRKNL